MKHLLCVAGYLAVFIGVLLNITTVIYKLTPVFRGELIGNDLEYTILAVLILPIGAVMLLGDLFLDIRRYHTTKVK